MPFSQVLMGFVQESALISNAFLPLARKYNLRQMDRATYSCEETFRRFGIIPVKRIFCLKFPQQTGRKEFLQRVVQVNLYFPAQGRSVGANGFHVSYRQTDLHIHSQPMHY